MALQHLLKITDNDIPVFYISSGKMKMMQFNK